MKKATALILVTILIIFIAATALAFCSHTWYDAGTTKKLISSTTVTLNGCSNYPNSKHDHRISTYKITQRYVCSKGCNATKTVTSTKGESKCLKK